MITKLLLAAVLLITACTTTEIIIDNEPFPVISERPEMGQMIYAVCNGTQGERIYQTSRCGDDTCWHVFYDGKGKLIEKTPEVGSGTPRQYELKTTVRDCARTTEAYFETKVRI